ncbi:MAG: hypothetical protein R3F65_27555 [bacterium]
MQAEGAGAGEVDVAAFGVAAGRLRADAEGAAHEGVEAPCLVLAAVAEVEVERGDEAAGLFGAAVALHGGELAVAEAGAEAEDEVAFAVDGAQVGLGVGAEHVLASDDVADGLVAEERAGEALGEGDELVELDVIDLLFAGVAAVAGEDGPAGAGN